MPRAEMWKSRLNWLPDINLEFDRKKNHVSDIECG